MRPITSRNSLSIAHIFLSLLSFLCLQTRAEWKVTNDSSKAVLLVAADSNESEAILIPASQTKVFSLKPHKAFSKFYVKKRLDVYQEDQHNIFYKKYTLVEREPSADIKENTFSFNQIAENNPVIKNRFVVHTFEQPIPAAQSK